MGLYDELPQSFAGSINQGLQRTAEMGPGLYRGYLQDQGIKQENTDRAYNSPARAANPHEAHIGGYVQKLFGDAPPQWQERLKKELAPTAPPSYMGGGGPDSGDHMVEPAAIGGYGLSHTPTPEQEFLAPQRQPLHPPVQQQGLTQDLGPMTQGDVQKYMSMAPLVQAENRQRKLDQQPTQRDYLGEIALRASLKGEEDRKTLGNKQGGDLTKQEDDQDFKARESELQRQHQWRIATLKNEAAMASIEARIKTGVTSAWEIAQLRSDTQIVASAMAAQSRELSSIPNLAKDKDLLSHNEEMNKRAQQAIINIEKMKANGPSNQPTGSASTKSKTGAKSTNNIPGNKVGVINEEGKSGMVAADKVEAWLKANPKRKKK